MKRLKLPNRYPKFIEGEEWREATYEGRNLPVWVSNMGRCFRAPAALAAFRGKVREIRGGLVSSPQVSVGGNVYNVRHLVAEAWIGRRPEPNLVVRHIDGNNKNLKAENLVWGMKRSNRKIGEDRFFNANGSRIGMKQINERNKGLRK